MKLERKYTITIVEFCNKTKLVRTTARLKTKPLTTARFKQILKEELNKVKKRKAWFCYYYSPWV